MFDIGWSEMMVVGVVALIVVGPKDLPKMFHTLGEFTGKARGMAREFQRAMDVAAKESGVGDIVKDIKRTTSLKGLKEATGLDGLEKELRDIGSMKPAATPAASPAATKDGPVLPPTPVPADTPDTPDALAAPEIEAQDIARRNAELSQTEAQRLKQQKKSEAARLKAAAIRAQKEADAAAAAAAEPDAES